MSKEMDVRPEQSQSGRRVAVFGATGHTARFVIAELQYRGFAPLAIGRDATRLAASGYEKWGVPLLTASIDDPDSLDRALAAAAAVINCAGPFLDTANAVAAAALRSRIHYLDVTAEQASAQATLDTFGTAARDVGVVVLPAMGFYGGLSDLLATAAVGDWNLVDIRIGIALDSWHPTSGTRVTGRRNTAQRLVIADGRLSPLSQPASESSWDFEEPFGRQHVIEVPLSEIILIARHLRVTELHTYMNEAPLRDLRDATTPPPKAADASGRSPQIFQVEAIAKNGNRTRRATASGRDIYAVTAPLVCEALERILAGAGQSGGAFAPGELFDVAAFLEALAPDHLSFEIKNE